MRSNFRPLLVHILLFQTVLCLKRTEFSELHNSFETALGTKGTAAFWSIARVAFFDISLHVRRTDCSLMVSLGYLDSLLELIAS